MEGLQEVAPSSQKRLVAETVIDALESSGESPRILTFDSGMARHFVGVGHELIVADPSGSWPRRLRFELVLCSGLLEVSVDDRAALSKLRPLLDSEALVLIAVPAAVAGRGPAPGTLRSYSREDLEGVVLRSGFVAERWLAEGPELHVAECRCGEGPGVDVVQDVAAALAEGRLDDAEGTLAHATAQMEDMGVVREYAMLVGHVHLARGRLAEALEAFTEASQLGDASARALTGMGAVAVSAGDMVAAADLFQAALQICPTSFNSLRGLGVAKEALGDGEGALTALDMAAVQRPAERSVAEKIVEVAVRAERSDAAAHAISRHARATNDEAWSRGIVARIGEWAGEGAKS